MTTVNEIMNQIRAELTGFCASSGCADFAALCDFSADATDTDIFRIKSRHKSGRPVVNEPKCHKLALAERSYFRVSPYSKAKFHRDDELFTAFMPVGREQLFFLIVKAAGDKPEDELEGDFENFRAAADLEIKVLKEKSVDLVEALIRKTG